MCHDCHKQAEGDTKQYNTLDCFFNADSVTGSVVKTDDRLAAQCDTAERHRDKEEVALYNGSTGDQNIPFVWAAIPLEDCIQNYEQYAVTGNDEKWGQTKTDDLSHGIPLKISPSQPNGHLFAPQGQKYE